MRMLSDSRAHASSPPPILITPTSSAATVLPQPPVAGSDASFDGDMVIILAAMLCILVCAIGLNSLVICFRRLHSGRRRTTTTVAATHSMVAFPATDAGLKKRELRKIPVVVYEAGNKVVSATEECAICLGEFDDGDKVCVLPRCNHGLHVPCIDVWLAAHPSCPTCRNSLLLDEEIGDDATPTVSGERALLS